MSLDLSKFDTEKFDINSNIDIQLNVSDDSHGYIKINTIEIQPTTPGVDENPYPWEGVYFKNIPITFKAIAKSPFRPIGIVLSSQQLYEVEKTSDQVIFLKQGVQKNLHEKNII